MLLKLTKHKAAKCTRGSTQKYVKSHKRWSNLRKDFVEELTQPTIMNNIKISDLMKEEGITFEIGEHLDNAEEDDDEFGYSSNVQYSNEEMLNMLNMNDFDDDEELDNMEENSGGVTLCGLSFSKLKAKMTKLTADGKVMKYVKQKGVGEVIPENGQVVVHYIGYFEDRDEPFDSTYVSGQPRTFRLSQNALLPGLEIGVRTMKKHEISVFLIHPDLAFKSMGCPPRIPPNEEVVFIVHLIDYHDDGYALTYQDLSLQEKQAFNCVKEPINHMLVTAKTYFTKMNYRQAVHQYKKAINYLEVVQLKNNSEEEEMNVLLSRAYTNLGLCYNKLNMPLKACTVLQSTPIFTAKTYYHFGKALLTIGDYDDALIKLKKGYDMEPENQLIAKTIQTANAKRVEYNEISSRMWKKCFKSNAEQKDSDFQKNIRDLCTNLIDNKKIMRLPLPEGITKKEYDIVREEAATLGLNVVTSTRNEKETIYIQKSKA
ncbi:hypothetical protein PUN28_012408 [Cardiocondyla obscurior]